MASCERYKQYILDLLDDELDVLQRKELENHLKTCRQCSLYASQCRKLRIRLKDLPKVEAGSEFSIVLRQRIRRELAKKRRYSPVAGLSPGRWIPAIGVAAIVLIASVWIFTRNRDTGKDPGLWTPPAAGRTEAPETREENINYVIDEVPALGSNGLLSENNDSEGRASLDSMLAERRAQLRSRVTQVSF